ncbi:ABC transporter, putative [Theileria annulata]|uniref:ABC transporter, putative n=1 Tax=Theileria annulata TaxID=5874 RepID=Q4UCR3_THEAN|nr:ABC transporter, putative [Theileria annulata]CAI75388.1 ABC transporter, putative [Theileria annulata]|eukprot:XP_954864.1 ABC transporter, putative [Theileria annulata]
MNKDTRVENNTDSSNWYESGKDVEFDDLYSFDSELKSEYEDSEKGSEPLPDDTTEVKEEREKKGSKKKKKYRNYSQSTGISFFFFSWMTDWIKLASKGKLKHEDFPDIPDSDFDQYATAEFGSCLDKYRDYEKCNKLVKLVGRSRLCVLKVFSNSFIFIFCFSIFNDIFEVFNSYLLSHVMKQKMPTTVKELFRYFALVLLVLIVNLVDIVTDGHHYFYYRRLVLRIENLLFSFLFSRILSKNHFSVENGPHKYEYKSESFIISMDPNNSFNISAIPRYHHKSSGIMDSQANFNLEKINKKSKKTSNSTKRPKNVRFDEEEISLLNLALFDISEIAWGILKLIDLLTIPLKILIIGCWLYYQVGATAIKAVCFIIISSVLMVLSEWESAKLVKGYVTRIDYRISKTLIILENLTNFKMFRWLNLCKESVLMSRIIELQLCLKRTILSSIGSWLGISLPNILGLAVFLIYSTSRERVANLDPAFTIPLLHTLNHFIKPFKDLPSDLSDHLETTISCVRIETFLFSKQLKSYIDTNFTGSGTSPNSTSPTPSFESTPKKSPDLTTMVKTIYEEEVETGRSTIIDESDNIFENGDFFTDDKENFQITKQEEEHTEEEKYVIYMKNATFCRAEKKIFTGISFKLRQRDKVVISGSNITEKFLFGMCLIDELQHTEGIYFNHYINKNMCTGIVSQSPWIPMGTIREIILFGNQYNRKLYEKIIEICQLSHDFANWKMNDMRFIDEGGQNLSTGQKVRISLARTLYTLYANNLELDNFKTMSSNGAVGMNNNGGKRNKSGNLVILDEIFTVLDPQIATKIFNNLFGKEGILNDFTCIITIQDSFLPILKDTKYNNYFKFYSLTTEHIQPISIYSHEEILEVENNEEDELDENNLPLERDYSRKSSKEHKSSEFEEESQEPETRSETEPEVSEVEKKKDEELDEREKLFGSNELFTDGNKNICLVKLENFIWYLKKVGLRLVILVVSVSFTAMMLNVGSDIVVSKWSPPKSKTEAMSGKISQLITMKRSSYLMKLNYLYIFTFLTSCTIVLFLWRSLLEVQGTLSAAHKVYSSALNGILKCPIVIFNKIPIGNINNRLSADQSYVDYSVFRRFSHFMSSFIYTFLTAASLCYLNPWSVLLIPLLILLSYFCVFKMYIPMSIFNMRSSLETRGYICSQFSQVISGSYVIKCLNNENYIMNNFLKYLKIHQNTKFFCHASSSWTMIRLKILTYPLIVINLLKPLIPLIGDSKFNSTDIQKIAEVQSDSDVVGESKKNGMVDGNIGLALTYSYKFAKLLKSTLNKIVELETEMCASQRLQELAKLDPDYDIAEEKVFVFKRRSKVNKTLVRNKINNINKRVSISPECLSPSNQRLTSLDQIEDTMSEGLSVSNVVVKYESKICLNQINFKTGKNEHVGLIGRTGAGKSTLLQSLAGLIKLDSGCIRIDGVDISKLSNEQMKDLVGILPHIPPLLPGWTVRRYIDSENKYADEEIYQAVQTCNFSKFIGYLLRCDFESKNKKDGDNTKPFDEQSEFGDYAESEVNDELIIGGDTFENLKQALDIRIAKQKENKCITVSDIDLQYLTLLKLYLNRHKLRLILIDECYTVEQNNKHKLEQITVIINRLFKENVVIIVAHQHESLSLCNRVLLLEGGKIGEIQPEN